MEKQWLSGPPASPRQFAVALVSRSPLRVAFVGDLDLASADELWAVLQECTTPGDPVAIDFRELTFIDCSGVSVIERLADRLAGAMLFLVNPSRRARRLLMLTGTAQRPDVRLEPSVIQEAGAGGRAVALLG